MKIKIPFTEKALKDIYNFLEDLLQEVGRSFPGPVIQPPRWYYRLSNAEYSRLSKFFNRKYRQRKIYQFINYLRQKGYLKTKNLSNYRIISWTSKGLEKIFAITAENHQRKRMDSKYLMVIFDIPEDKKKQRDHFRRMLKLLNYKQLQKSVWISSFDVMQETKSLIKILNLDPFVELFILEKVALKH